MNVCQVLLSKHNSIGVLSELCQKREYILILKNTCFQVFSLSLCKEDIPLPHTMALLKSY